MRVLDQEKVDRLKQILKWHPRGMTISDLATQMDTNRNLVAKYLDMLLISGQVEMEVVGAAKVYFLSNRVPISSMIEFSSDMVIVLDGDQKIVQVNEPILSLIREKKDVLVGRHLQEIDNPFVRALPIHILAKDMKTAPGQVHEMECELEGKKHHFRVKQLQTAFEDGSHGTTLIIEDITAQITYQNMLELNEARYRGIVEDQTEFITRFLPEGTLVFVNDAYARYLGKRKEDLLGGPHIPDLVTEDMPEVARGLQSLSVNNPVITFECRIRDTCGEDRWNLWTVRVLFDNENMPVEYQGIGRDNTEKREAASRINQYIKDMEFISRKSQEFVELSPDTNIFDVIGKGLLELLPSAVIVVNSYNAASDTLTIRTVQPDSDRKNLTMCLGQDIVGFQFHLGKVPEQLRTLSFSQLRTGKIFHIDENIYTICFYQVPQDVCDRIEEVLHVKDRCYGIGLFRHGIFFGTVTIALRNGEMLTNASLVETFIHQVSIILHRRLTEESLKASEARYRGIVEDQTELITRFLSDGTITFVNESFCRYFQVRQQEVIGRSIFSLIPTDEQTMLLHDLRILDVKNPVQSVEHRDVDPSGRIRWSIWTNRALFDDTGAIIEYQGVGRDITEQKLGAAKINQYIAEREFLVQTAMALMEMTDDADLYQYIANQIHAIIPDQVIVISSINQTERTTTLQSIAGLDPAVIQEFRDHGVFLFGKPFSLDKDPDFEASLQMKSLTPGPRLYNLLFREFPEEVCTLLENSMGFGKSYVMGFIHEGKIFGSVIIILRPGQELKNKETIELFLNQVSIALLHKNARQELKESEKLYRNVIENIQDVFYRSDKEGNLIMASPSWAKLLGYASLQDCIGYNIAEKFWFEAERRKEFLDALNRYGSVRDYEVVLKRKDGSPLYVSTNSHLYYDNAGSLLGVEGIFRDISERQTAAEKIRTHISQLEFFSRKLQEFIELPPDSDIYHAIGKGLEELLPDSLIIVNNYDHDCGKLMVKALIGDKAQAIAQKYLHSDLAGVSFQIDEIIPENISAGKIYSVREDFHSVVSRNFSPDISEAIIRELNLGDFYYISLVWGESFLGNVTFGLPKGEKLEKIPFIELYGKAASMALQRHLADDSLKESREIFSSVAAFAPVPIAIIEPDGRYQFVNQRFTEIFGYDLNDFKTGKEWFSLAYPDPEYRKHVIATWKSDLEASLSGQQRPEIFTVRCKNGLDREIIFRPVTLSDNKQCIVYEDITEQRAAGQVQKLLSSIVETSRDAIISKKTDGTIISWNKAAEQLYGYTRDEMIGRNISIIIPPERQEESEELFKGIKNGKSATNIETLRVRKDGRIIDVALTISPITDDAGVVIGASTIGRDISVKKSEERLMEDEEKYRTIVEHMKLGMYRSTGDPKGRFVWGNTSLLEILGYPSFDVLRQIEIADLFAEPDGREKFLADLKRSGFVMNREIDLKRADSKQICVRVTALAKFNPGGDIEYINGTVEDITEHKQDLSELQALRQETYEIIEFLPDPAWIIDQDHTVIAWNSAMEHITGIGKNEIIGHSESAYAINTQDAQQPTLFDLLEASDDEIRGVYSHVSRAGDSVIAEGFIPSLYSGHGAYAWIKVSQLHDGTGKRIGAIGIIRDISMAIETKELLKNRISGFGPETTRNNALSQKVNSGFSDALTETPGILNPFYLSQALKMAQDYIAILDKSGKCLWVNNSLASAVYSDASADLLGKNLALFIAPEFRKAALNCLTHVKKNGPKNIPLMMLSSSGRIPVEANISAITAQNGDLFGFIAVARNVEKEKVERPK